MRKVSILILMFVALLAGSVMAEGEKKAEKKAHDFVGAKKCKGCHQDQFKAWSETAHAKSFDALSDEEKKDPKCIECHTSGTTAKGVLSEGVQCEACHGAGKDYKSLKIMSKKKWKADPDTHKKMAIEAGLVEQNEEVCIRCHKKEGNANFKEFDYAKSKGTVHPVPAEPTK